MVKNSKKLKQKKFVSEDMIKVRNMIILLVIVVAICIGLYFLTNKMIENDNKKTNTQQEVTINYDIATVGTMFNRPENEYFVILYSEENDGAEYSPVLAQYRSSDKYIKTYFVDIDKYVNKEVLKDKLNQNPTTSEEVSITGPTLYKVVDGKVTKCYDSYETISEILK